MSDVRVRWRAGAERDLERSPATGQALRKVAENVATRVQAPSDMAITTRAGVGRRGAFSQVIMTGPGAIAVEFGTRSRAPRSPLRTAIGSVLGRLFRGR